METAWSKSLRKEKNATPTQGGTKMRNVSYAIDSKRFITTQHAICIAPEAFQVVF